MREIVDRLTVLDSPHPVIYPERLPTWPPDYEIGVPPPVEARPSSLRWTERVLIVSLILAFLIGLCMWA